MTEGQVFQGRDARSRPAVDVIVVGAGIYGLGRLLPQRRGVRVWSSRTTRRASASP
jgi:hypothetical protein